MAAKLNYNPFFCHNIFHIPKAEIVPKIECKISFFRNISVYALDQILANPFFAFCGQVIAGVFREGGGGGGLP